VHEVEGAGGQAAGGGIGLDELDVVIACKLAGDGEHPRLEVEADDTPALADPLAPSPSPTRSSRASASVA